MTNDAEDRAERIHRASIQEQRFVRSCRDPAFRVHDGKKTDCIVFRKGRIEIIDCKFTDNSEFYISKDDIIKGLDLVAKILARDLSTAFGVEMWFPRHRKKRIVYIDEKSRGYSVRVWVTPKKIMAERVYTREEI